MSLVARYRSPTTFEFVVEECCDVSVGGMFIKSDNPAPAGTLLKLECDASGSATIRGVARVVWLRQSEGAEGPRGMGVKFVRLEPAARGIIEDVVSRMAQPTQAPEEPEEPNPSDAAERATTAEASVTTREGERGGESSDAHEDESGADSAAARAEPASDADESGAREALHGIAPQEGAVAATALASRPVTDTLVHAPVPDADEPRVLPAGPPQADVRAASGPAPARPSGQAGQGGQGGKAIWIAVSGVAVIFVAVVSWAGFDEIDLAQSDAPPAQQEVALTKRLSPAKASLHAAAHPLADEAAAPQARALDEEAHASAAQRPGDALSDAAPSELGAASASSAAPEPPAVLTPTATTTAQAPDVAEARDARPHVLEVITQPAGATVKVAAAAFVAPGRATLVGLPTRVRVSAELAGHTSSAIWIERASFGPESKHPLFRRVYMSLKPAPKAEEALHGTERVGSSEGAPSKPGDAAASPPLTAQAAEAAETAEPTKLSTAAACAVKGDNQCVLDALGDAPNTAREYELLIETLRAMGRAQPAQSRMREYLQRFPSGPRVASYARLLQTQAQPDRVQAEPQPTPQAGSEAEPAPAPAAPAPAPP